MSIESINYFSLPLFGDTLIRPLELQQIYYFLIFLQSFDQNNSALTTWILLYW